LVIQLPRSVRLRGARDVQVLTPGGRSLAHRAHLSGRVLTIKLALAHSPVRVLFPTGSLHVRGRLRGRVSVEVSTVDRVGGHLTLTRTPLA
jgi:ubiquinone biosynthesis protein UbiJ